MNGFTWVKDMRTASAVKRFHTVRMQPQTLADHCHGVILALLAAGCRGHDLLTAAALHDAAEVHTGDIPAPAKWASPALEDALQAIELQFNIENDIKPNLTEYEKLALSWADSFDLAMRCQEEMMQGNRYVEEMYGRVYPRCESAVEAFFDYLRIAPSHTHAAWAHSMRSMNARLAEDYTAIKGA